MATPPARAQGETSATSDPATQAPSIRERWSALSEDEQRRLFENYEKWKRLDSDERTLLKRRFERLEVERRRARDTLDGDDRRRFERLRDADRRRELTQRAKSAVRDRFEKLPPDLRERVEHDLRTVPPKERADRIRQSLRQRVQREVTDRLGRKVDQGELPREAVDELGRKTREANGAGESAARERLELLRKLLVEHPQAFDLTAEQVERLKNSSDAGFALHLLDRIRRRPPRPPMRDR